jgi:hypothetical protein
MPWVRQTVWHIRGPGQGDSGPVVHLAVGPTETAGQCRAGQLLGQHWAGGGASPPPPLPPSHPWPGPPLPAGPKREGSTAQQPGRLSHAPEAAFRSAGAGRAPEAARRKPRAGSRAPQAARRKPRAGSRAPEAARRKPRAGSRAPQAARRKPRAGYRTPEAARRKSSTGINSELNLSQDYGHCVARISVTEPELQLV